MSILTTRPRLSPADAERLARDRFGIDGAATPLPSDRDQNFLLRVGDAAACVLKIANAREECALLDCQHDVMSRLAAHLPAWRFPEVIPSVDGQAITTVEVDGAAYPVRALTWVPGIPFAAARPRVAALCEGAGRLLGAMARSLDGWESEAARRVLDWDLRRGREVVGRLMDGVADSGRRALLARHLDDYDGAASAFDRDLRIAVIHGDANDHNVLVTDLAPGGDPFTVRRVEGIVDFGDVVESWVVGEAAIAAAYAMLDRANPIDAAVAVARGFHAEHPLEEPEIAALHPLIVLRLCTSVTMSAHQRAREPDNAYLSISEAQAWRLLEQLARVSPSLVHYRLRAACGLEPCPSSRGIRTWLDANRDSIVPVVENGSGVPPVELDLGAGSLEAGALDPRAGADEWSAHVVDAMRAAGATLGIGHWNEARSWYTEEAFRIESDEADTRRTVHIGVDVFAEAGTPVRAPLDGVVHAAKDNAGHLDYGPTILLRHDIPDGPGFFTLYGHLSRESLSGLEAGTTVRRGERIASIGDAHENGGWAPHLHLQVIADMLGRDGEYPGVASPTERDVWLSLSPDPAPLIGLASTEAIQPPSNAELIERRAGRIGPSLSIAYRKRLHIVRGRRQYLYDQAGQPFLDAVNNVAHVGHAHPRVNEAAARQASVLNTNTRYLHETLLRYAERLGALLPDPLSVCYFVCSGSEANELALRLARAHTRRRGMVVLGGAYHGNTSSLIELSPYKFDGPGGEGAPAHVRVAALPDGYRGPFRGSDRETGTRYADSVRDALASLEKDGIAPAAFFAEPMPGCGGQIVLPDGYLVHAYAHARAAGALCIADEVQTGFGRAGTHFWAFETQGVIPDIVTLGKPIGNGHPLGAVVTTPEIAASFDNGMEYFNTFGGNPVSCATGLAVLDVIEDEGLQRNARDVGARLLMGLAELRDRHPLVGDVRGLGLYIGVELVLDRASRAPAGRHAAYVAERMRDHGILLSTDGPDHNVIKIKPPLVFEAPDADRLVSTLDRIMQEDALRVD